MTDITAIVPLDLGYRPKDILDKAIRLADAAEKANVRMVFGLNDRGTRIDRELKKRLQGFTTSTIVLGKLDYDSVNMSALRNLAFSAVESEYLVLLDVDIWPDFQILQKYQEKIGSGHRPFYFLPCLYLTEAGSRHLAKQAKDTAALTAKYFSFSRKEFLHLASPSSITVMQSRDYHAIGGFNVSFVGHGYEDFDFMLRLAARYDEVHTSPDFLTRGSARSPLFATGFKRDLGRICFDPLLEKDFVYHLHHEKAPTSRFYAARTDNFERFAAIHSSFVEGADRDDPTLISEFLMHCRQSGKNINDYSILFENKPGHIDRYDTFRRRLRFLLP